MLTGQDLGQPAAVDDTTLLEQHRAVAHRLDHGHLVRDEQHGQAELGPHAAQEVQHARRAGLVEGGGGLVAEQHRRADGERAGDGHPLLLPAGQLRRVGPGALSQPHQIQQLGGPAPALGPADPGELERVLDVARGRP